MAARTGARGLTASILDEKALKVEADLDELVQPLPHLLKRIIANLRSDNARLTSEMQKQRTYLKDLVSVIHPVDLRPYEHEVYGFSPEHESYVVANGLGVQTGLNKFNIDEGTLQVTWTSLSDWVGYVSDKSDYGYSQCDFPIDNGQFAIFLDYITAQGGRRGICLDDVISGPMLFYRLFRMGYRPLRSDTLTFRLDIAA